MQSLLSRILFILLSLAAIPAFAQTEAAQTELKAAVQEVRQSLVHGPTVVYIQDQATLKLPAGYTYAPTASSLRLLRALGNTIDEKSLVGLVFPPTDGSAGQWMTLVQMQKGGYVRDDDASHWKAADLLKGLQDNTERDNAARRSRGLPEIAVTGWAEVPAYDSTHHWLKWSSIVRAKSELNSTNLRVDSSVNYRTLVLGREGYLSLTLITNLSALVADKPAADQLLADTTFVDGKRYSDFNSGTDHVAEYGLAALVIGLGAKKLGLLALIGAFALKFFKAGLLLLAAFGAAMRRFFKRQPKAGPIPAPQALPTDVDPTTSEPPSPPA